MINFVPLDTHRHFGVVTARSGMRKPKETSSITGIKTTPEYRPIAEDGKVESDRRKNRNRRKLYKMVKQDKRRTFRRDMDRTRQPIANMDKTPPGDNPDNDGILHIDIKI